MTPPTALLTQETLTEVKTSEENEEEKKDVVEPLEKPKVDPVLKPAKRTSIIGQKPSILRPTPSKDEPAAALTVAEKAAQRKKDREEKDKIRKERLAKAANAYSKDD